MPKRTDITSIAIIGAGPIVIGQACEFDYSGAQACKALREEGYRVILINSNPATIMTDPEMADATYIEPITPQVVAQILEKERPDALLPTMGGQTGLNTALALADDGTLERLGIELIGARRDAIRTAEDRELFRRAMDEIGLASPRAFVVNTLEQAREHMEDIGLPAIIRPSFTLGGTGGGIAYNVAEFEAIVRGGLDASPVTEVLIEESVLGWKEYEMEVVRDHADNAIIICSIENVDPMGVHTGDSITVAPALTLTDKEYQIMRNASIAVLRRIGVETGGSNVQFAVNPGDGRLVVIEMNPRVSRSSALASKATGFPIARVAAKLAVGYTLDELPNDITGGATPASFEPTIDYIVTKIPRFAFEKFRGSDETLTTSMKSVGEAMAMGRNFEESVQKALRSLETGLSGFDNVLKGPDGTPNGVPRHELSRALSTPGNMRLLVVAQAMRAGFSDAEIHRLAKYDPWFLARIRNIVEMEAGVIANGLPDDAQAMQRLKAHGFSDARLAKLSGKSEADVSTHRLGLGLKPVYKRVDSCAGEFPATTPYMYSTYEGNGLAHAQCEAGPTPTRKIAILGGGPNRIGQGIEFDYCCCHAAFALSDAGFETIMVNCNPETVSTDWDTSDRLYFEPLTAEDVTALLQREAEAGTLEGVIVQFGGQTPLKLARALEAAHIPVLGTSPDAIDLAEDRERFQKLLDQQDLQQPPNGIARTLAEAEAIAERIGYPVVLRPSYVLGGRAMEIVHDVAELRHYMDTAVEVSGDSPVLVDYYLQDAIEVDVDAICDGESVLVGGIMEHIEEAGIHSGDSACALPPFSLSQDIQAELTRQTQALALSLGVRGLMNVQFAVQGAGSDTPRIFVLEVNPRASRTVPFVGKATGLPMAKIAALVMSGMTLENARVQAGGRTGDGSMMAVKEAVFPFRRFPGVDVILGPEMRSTGEVMGFDRDFAAAFAKSQLGAGTALPLGGTCFISVKDRDKPAAVEIARRLQSLGFELIATHGTATTLEQAGIPVAHINKVTEGQPHIVDAMINGKVQLVLNTTEGAQAITDSFSLRQTALANNIAYYTTIPGSRAAVEGIAALQNGNLDVGSLQAHLQTS